MSKTLDKINELIASMPRVDPKEVSTVQAIFYDGEQTCEKAGELFRQRTCHCTEPALTVDQMIISKLLIHINLPDMYGKHPCIYLHDPHMKSTFPAEIRKLIREFIVELEEGLVVA